MRYVVYGLDLNASFPLPGMPTASSSESLPSLSLELSAPAELDETWSGREGPIEWTGRLGDGCELTIERGNAGDVLFTYGDRARFRLDSTTGRLQCSPWREGLDWQRALLSRILPNVGIIKGYEALHASAVQSPDGVVAIAAPSGMGKTTLAAELARRGWPLFTDDVLILGDGEQGVRAHPGTPHMNMAANAEDETLPDALGTSLGVLAGERWVAARAAAEQAAPVRMICLYERGPDLELEAQVLPSNPLPLSPYMLGLMADTERARRRFACYADLVGDATLLRLTAQSADQPSDIGDLVVRCLESQAHPRIGNGR